MARQSAIALGSYCPSCPSGNVARRNRRRETNHITARAMFFCCAGFNCYLVVVSVSSQKVGLAGRGGLYKYSINTYCTSKSNRSGFSGHAKYPQFRSHRNSCFFTWKSRHLFIPVTSDFSHCIYPLASHRAEPPLAPFPLCSRVTPVGGGLTLPTSQKLFESVIA